MAVARPLGCTHGYGTWNLEPSWRHPWRGDRRLSALKSQTNQPGFTLRSSVFADRHGSAADGRGGSLSSCYRGIRTRPNGGTHMKMMNASTEPTESSQRLWQPYILAPSASNYKSKFSQVHMIHDNLSTIIYQSGFQRLLTLRWQ